MSDWRGGMTPLAGAMTIEICPYMRPGRFLVWGQSIHVRHMSELMLCLQGATWHPERSTCPTWTAANECTCMVNE